MVKIKSSAFTIIEHEGSTPVISQVTRAPMLDSSRSVQMLTDLQDVVQIGGDAGRVN